VPKPGFLDGVDLPDLMDARGTWSGGCPRSLGPTRPMDLGRSKGELEGPCRGKFVPGDPEFTGRFDANHLGAPVGVEFLHVAGLGHDLVVGGATAAEWIPRLQAVKTALLKDPPDLPNRVVRHAEFEGDLGEFLSVQATADDFLSDRHR
jgi:hypothetical protein